MPSLCVKWDTIPCPRKCYCPHVLLSGGEHVLRRYDENGKSVVIIRVARTHPFRSACVDVNAHEGYSIYVKLGDGRIMVIPQQYPTLEEAYTVAQVWYDANKPALYGYPVKIESSDKEFEND